MKRLLISILTLCLLAACGDDAVPVVDPGQHDTSPYISFAMQKNGCADWQSERRGTRLGDEGQAIPAAIPQTVGIWGYNSVVNGLSAQGYGEVFNNQRMYYFGSDAYHAAIDADPNSDLASTFTNWQNVHGDNCWPYYPLKPWVWDEGGDVRYKFYAYAPYTESGMGKDLYADSLSYAGFGVGNSIQWRRLRRLSNTDYLIAEKVLQYQAKEIGNPPQQMRLKHLYSRLRFRFRLHDEFGDRRWIHVKRMEVTSLPGFLLQADIEFEAADADVAGTTIKAGDIVPRIGWSQLNEQSSSTLVLDNDPEAPDGIYIKKSNNKDGNGIPVYQSLASLYIYPYDDRDALNIRVTYDVYDNDDQLVRSDEKSITTLTLNLKSGSTATDGRDSSVRYLAPGYYYNVNITVNPAYLYVLDDNDFDADGTIKIE